MPDDAPEADGSFAFLFRTDRGLIDRATWWRGTVPIALIGLVATVGWLMVRPYTYDAIDQPPALALLGYVYLLVFSFATLLLFVCEYNLSAKRFAARGRPRALAAALPASVFAAGILAWYIPRSEGALPDWTIWIAPVCVLIVVFWYVLDLGILGRSGRGDL